MATAEWWDNGRAGQCMAIEVIGCPPFMTDLMAIISWIWDQPLGEHVGRAGQCMALETSGSVSTPTSGITMGGTGGPRDGALSDLRLSIYTRFNGYFLVNFGAHTTEVWRGVGDQRRSVFPELKLLLGLRAVAVADGNGSRRDGYRPVPDMSSELDAKRKTKQTLYPSTAVTGLTDGSRPSAPLGALSDGRVDQAVAKKRPFLNRPSDGTDGPEP
ncbi:hypothetical protein B0H16DRAFT_1780170 [Mycena metata]|uniref:Uncharacterized protein n=1 Tax=Mycena metata TaxID=1033252 RepID=A0AAD7HT57_9AGAR|nr:hypothetical protein B0H16DRAFT_1780170 [Mycena metata]